MQRIITVVSTRNSKIVRINENRENLTLNISASGLSEIQGELDDFLTTWGDVKKLLGDKISFDFNNLLATEKVSKNSLVNDAANIPDGDVTIFLRPIETKAGSGYQEFSFSDMRNEVERLGSNCKTFLNSTTSKNWTQLSREELRAGLEAYNPTYKQEETLGVSNEEELVLTLLEDLERKHGYNSKLDNAIDYYKTFLDELYEIDEEEEQVTLSPEDQALLDEASKY